MKNRPPSTHASQRPLIRQQHGMALIEALIASAILGIGLVGAMQLTLKTLYMASENRQHTTAQQLAKESMDCLLAHSSLCPVEDQITRQGVGYSRQSISTPRGADPISDLRVSVTWSPTGGDLSGTPPPVGVRRITWHSSVSTLPGWVGTPAPSSLLP